MERGRGNNARLQSFLSASFDDTERRYAAGHDEFYERVPLYRSTELNQSA